MHESPENEQMALAVFHVQEVACHLPLTLLVAVAVLISWDAGAVAHRR
jgi:hypothetical protein